MSDYVLDFDTVTPETIFDNNRWSGIYSKQVSKPQRDDETGIYTATNLYGEVIKSIKLIPESIVTCFDTLEHAAYKWPDCPFLGYRKQQVGLNGNVTFGEYQWYTYKEVHRMVKIFGTALTTYNGGVETTVITDCFFVKSAKFVGIFAKNSPKWLMFDFACSGYKLVSVPLYETMGIQSIIHISNQTELKVLCTDSSKLGILYENQDKLVHLKLVIIMDGTIEDHKQFVEKLRFKTTTFDELIKMYEDKIASPIKSTNDDLATIIYTSGTTGMPKGAVFTHEPFTNHVLRYLSTGNRLNIRPRPIALSFLPLVHVYQRFIEHTVVFFGGQIGYYSGDVKLLLDDIQALKPTFIIGVPRIFNKLHDRISSGIAQRNQYLQILINKAIEIRSRSFRESICPIKLFFANILLSKITKLFGGRLVTMITGSSLISPKVSFEIQGMLGSILTEGWGMTENGFTTIRDGMDTDNTIIGGPLGMVQFKLRSLPDLNYFVTDNPPRGELLVRGNGFFKCYFRNKELTAATIDSDRWMSTGDVVELTSSNGIRIIDRAKSIFKLSQGEYIAPEKLENIYITCDLVDQIYVHGQSDKSFLVAIVVLSPQQLENWKNANPGIQEDKMNETLETYILDQFDQLAKVNSFNSLERIRRAHITTEPFTIDNGLITPTLKNIRKKLALYFKPQIDEMYTSQENNLSTIKF